MSIEKPNITVNQLNQYVQSISPQNGSLSWTDAYQVVVYDVPAALVTDACSLILGFSYLNSANQLCRYNQIRHPLFNWLAAQKIESVVGLGPRGKTPVPQVPNIAGLPAFTALYVEYRITVVFNSPLYKLLDDTAPPISQGFPGIGQDLTGSTLGFVRGSNEWLRNFYLEAVEETTNFITLEGGQAIFNDPSLSGNLATYQGKPFNSPGRSIAEVMQLYKFVWEYVPEIYCGVSLGFSGAGIRVPVFTNYLNLINSVPFLGFPAFTLLMEPFGYERYRMPVSNTSDQPNYWARVTFNLKYFNPPTAASTATITVNGVDQPVAGHLLVPLSVNNKYYQATRFNPSAAVAILNGQTFSGDTGVIMTSTSGVVAGQQAYAAGSIPLGTTVTGVTPNAAVTLSQPATNTGQVSIYFGPGLMTPLYQATNFYSMFQIWTLQLPVPLVPGFF